MLPQFGDWRTEVPQQAARLPIDKEPHQAEPFPTFILERKSVVSQKTRPSSHLTKRQVVDLYFMEHRAKLLDIAAYLDRTDRADAGQDVDFRQAAFLQALSLLATPAKDRVKLILELFSVTDNEIPQSADGLKGASGAVPISSASPSEQQS